MARTKTEYRTASKETYTKFKLKYPELNLSYRQWGDIVYTFNYAFRDHLLETGLKANYPYGFGTFCITKYKRNHSKTVDGVEKILLPIDWQKTKAAGKVIYQMNFHSDGYKCRWMWYPHTARFLKSDIWTFKPSRVSSRLIKHYITQGYIEKYLQWKA